MWRDGCAVVLDFTFQFPNLLDNKGISFSTLHLEVNYIPLFYKTKLLQILLAVTKHRPNRSAGFHTSNPKPRYYDDIEGNEHSTTQPPSKLLEQSLPSSFQHHRSYIMANVLDTDAGSELFSSYEAELKLVQADLSQKLEQIPDLAGEPRKAAISSAERALEEASELVRLILNVTLSNPNTTHSSTRCASRSKTSPLQLVRRSTNDSVTTNLMSMSPNESFALYLMTAPHSSARDTRITRMMCSSSSDNSCFLEQTGWIAARKG